MTHLLQLTLNQTQTALNPIPQHFYPLRVDEVAKDHLNRPRKINLSEKQPRHWDLFFPPNSPTEKSPTQRHKRAVTEESNELLSSTDTVTLQAEDYFNSTCLWENFVAPLENKTAPVHASAKEVRVSEQLTIIQLLKVSSPTPTIQARLKVFEALIPKDKLNLFKKLTELDFLKIANELLDPNTEVYDSSVAQTWLLYESYTTLKNSYHDSRLSRKDNEIKRVQTYLNHLKSTSLPLSELFQESRTPILTPGQEKMLIETCSIANLLASGITEKTWSSLCKEVFEIQKFSGLFEQQGNSSGTENPYLRAGFTFANKPLVCITRTHLPIMVLPNGELFSYEDYRMSEDYHQRGPDFYLWDPAAFGLKLSPALPRQVIDAKKQEGKHYHFLRWETEMNKVSAHEEKHLRDYVKDRVEIELQKLLQTTGNEDREKTLFQTIARRFISKAIPNQAPGGGNSPEEYLDLLFFLVREGISLEIVERDCAIHALELGVQAMQGLTGHAKLQKGFKTTLSALLQSDYMPHAETETGNFTLPSFTAEEIITTANSRQQKKLKEIVLKKVTEIANARGEGYQEENQSTDTATLPVTTIQDQPLVHTPKITPPSPHSPTTLFPDKLIIQPGSLLDAPISVMKQLLFPASDGMSLQSLLEIERKFSDSNSYFYEVSRAKTLLLLQAKKWAESSGNEALSEEEQVEAYLTLIQAVAPLEKPEWKIRKEIREDEKETLTNSTSSEVTYTNQFLAYLRDHEKSYIQAEVARIFSDSRLPYSEFKEIPKAAWTVSALLGEGRKAPTYVLEANGLGLYGSSPIILRTQSRYLMIRPNGQLFFYNESPIQANGLPDRNAIALGLGIKGDFSSLQLTASQAPPSSLLSIRKEIETRVEDVFAIDLMRTSHLVEDCQLSYSDFTTPCQTVWIISKIEVKNEKLKIDPIFGYGLYAHPPMLCLTQSSRYVLIYPNGGLFSYDASSLPEESNPYDIAVKLFDHWITRLKKQLSIGTWEVKRFSFQNPFSLKEEVARRMQKNFSIDLEKKTPSVRNTLSQAILQTGLRFYQMLARVVSNVSYEPDPEDFLVNHRQLLSPLLTGQIQNSGHVEELAVPDFQSDDFSLLPSKNKEEIGEGNSSFIIPKFLEKNLLPFTQERLISLRLDAIEIVSQETITTASINNKPIINGSLLDIRITTMERLLLLSKTTENRWKFLQIANWFLFPGAPSYDPDRATTLTYLESLVWAEKSDNQNLTETQRVKMYLNQTKTLDPEVATVKLNDTEINKEAWTPLSGIRLKIRLLALKSLLKEDFDEPLKEDLSLLKEDFDELSEEEQFKITSDIYDVTAEDYSEPLALALAKREMQICEKEAASSKLSTEENPQECLYSFSCVPKFPETLKFIGRKELAEQSVRKDYPDGNYGYTVLKNIMTGIAGEYGVVSPTATFEEKVQETLDLGGSNGLDSEYYAQFSNFFNKNGEILTEMRAEASFRASKLPCSDYIREVKRAWVIRGFAPVYHGCDSLWGECTLSLKKYPPIEETGANIYPALPLVFESASGRFGMITPNGNLFIYEETPLISKDELGHYKVARGLGLHNSSSSIEGYNKIKKPFLGWSLQQKALSTLEPLRDLMKIVHSRVIKTEIEKIKKNNYSSTLVQEVFFSIVFFLKLIVELINDEHAEVDITDLVLDCADLIITLSMLGIPVTKLTSATVKAIRAGTKGLSGIKRIQVGSRTALKTLFQAKDTGIILKELIDSALPIFTAGDLVQTTAFSLKKLTTVFHKKVETLLGKRGLLKISENAPRRCRRMPVTTRLQTEICSPYFLRSRKRTKPRVDAPSTPRKQPKARNNRERTPNLAPTTFKKAAQQHLASALAKDADTHKDVIFEKMRKKHFLPSREESMQITTNSLERQYNDFEKAKRFQKKNAALSNDLKTTYETLGESLLARERSLFEQAQNKFEQELEKLFREMQAENPALKRTDYILDFPKVKLELKYDEATILSVGYPVIRIVEDGNSPYNNISFLLRLIQTIIGKGPLKHDRVYYEISLRDIKGQIAYRGFEKTPKIIYESPTKEVSIYSRVDVPQIFVGQDEHIRYKKILKLLNGDVLRHLDNNERNLAKVVRDFMNEGRLSGEIRDQALREQMKERLSAFALITQISEEARTANTGTAVDRLLTELATVSDKKTSFLKIEWQGNSKTLSFPEIFNQENPLLSFMKEGGASLWRKEFKTERIRMERLLEDQIEGPLILTHFGSPTQRDFIEGVRPLVQHTPLRLRKDRSIPDSRSLHKAPLQEDNPVKKEGASWKEKAFIIATLAALPGAAAILAPLAVCYAIQWYQKKQTPNPVRV